MQISPKEDILAHVLDVTHGKINTYPVISVIQSRDITYPDFTGIAPTQTAMVLTQTNVTYEVYMVMLSDDIARDLRIVSYGSHDDYAKALQMAMFYGIIDK